MTPSLRRALACLATLALAAAPLVAAPLAAQGADPLPAGTRVRVQPESGGEYEGVVLSTAGGVLAMANRGSRVEVPMEQIAQLEVARGKDRGRGARRGALVGTSIGLLTGVGLLLTEEDCVYTPFEGTTACDRPSKATTIGAAGIVGLVIGTVTGSLVGAERWEAMTPPVPGTSMRLTPWLAPDGRVGLAVTRR